ncbi:MAG: sulfatase-like hydrolase/transferase, partial [Gammaproteobacteria bacterium]|nr:sulfatase-like hydrolase/transferase [Gammaproteobacteria bacterium]
MSGNYPIKSMQMFFLLLFALPVLGAQYFSLDQSPLGWVSAILSLCLLVLLLGLVLARLPQGVVRNSVGLGMITLLACYFFGQFVSYYLQGSYFNQQFYFHFNLRSVTQTWAVYWPLTAIFLVWLACLWLCFLRYRNHVDTSKPSEAFLFGLLAAALFLDPGLRQSAIASLNGDNLPEIRSLAEVDWQRMKLNQAAVENQEFSASAGKNLVLVFMEGLDTIYTEDEIFPALTPNLNRFNEEGWQLDNLRPVEGSLWTMGGIVSSLCGTPLLHDFGLDGNVVLFTGFLDQASCLPDVLDKAGYRQVFMGGASMDFGGKGEFLGAHAFDKVLGREELIPELDDPSYLGGWGLYDESLLALAAEEYAELAEMDRPFNLSLLTVDTHHPTGEPSPGCPSYERIDNSILHSVHCTDFLVGRFIDQLKQHPAYENTVIVLASDHLGMRNNAFSLFPENYERKLYFSVLNAQPAVPADRLATPMDLAPTLLSLMQVQHNASFLAGGDLSQGEMLTIEDAEIFAQRQELIRFINSNYLSSQGTGGVLYSLEQSRLAEFDFSQHVNDPELSSRGLSFTSVGDDPFILLPELTIDSPAQARLYVTLETDQASAFTLYYESDENPDYSEANTISHSTAAGENHLVFNLDDVA